MTRRLNHHRGRNIVTYTDLCPQGCAGEGQGHRGGHHVWVLAKSLLHPQTAAGIAEGLHLQWAGGPKQPAPSVRSSLITEARTALGNRQQPQLTGSRSWKSQDNGLQKRGACRGHQVAVAGMGLAHGSPCSGRQHPLPALQAQPLCRPQDASPPAVIPRVLSLQLSSRPPSMWLSGHAPKALCPSQCICHCPPLSNAWNAQFTFPSVCPALGSISNLQWAQWLHSLWAEKPLVCF